MRLVSPRVCPGALAQVIKLGSKSFLPAEPSRKLQQCSFLQLFFSLSETVSLCSLGWTTALMLLPQPPPC